MQNKKTGVWSSIKNFWYFCGLSFKNSPFVFSMLLTTTIFGGILPIVVSKYFGKLIDEIVNAIQTKNESAMWVALVVYVIVRTVPSLIDTIRNVSFRFWFLKFQNFIDIYVLGKRAEFDIAHVENSAFQDKIMAAFNNGTFPIMNLLDVGIQNIKNIFLILASSTAILLIDWRILIIILFFSTPSFLIESKYGKRIWNIFQESSREQREHQYLRQFFTAKYPLIEAKLLGIQNDFLIKIKDILTKFVNRQTMEEKKTTTLRILAELISALGITFSIFLAIKGSAIGSISVGTIVFLFTIVGNLESAISNLLINIARGVERNLYVSGILEVINVRPVIINTKNPKEIANRTPEIEFKNIYFKYPGKDNYILENISFKIAPGEKIGLVGHNGAGKTTIVRLLLRIHDPSEGEILINGINLKELDYKEWWEKIAVLPQDFSTLCFKTKETIASGNINRPLDIDLVKKSAELSTASDFIERWKEKYDSVIGVEFGGEELSKGERQKMALARVLYRNSNFTILDEPTASVDAHSASIIFENLRNMAKEKSAMFISHNFGTIKSADRIILMEHGKILEEGTHTELMKLNGAYACLYKQQEKDFTC
ncbi:MAG: ABC transporter ATP-binding protein [Candidatus Paceibacterota bacterium]|jgi:ABC-type multidrug transport system fused ATPase/permease subunit